MSPSEKLMQRYSQADGRFDLPRDGPFWRAVAEAHRRGRRGQGVRIAILDSGFDLAIPALAAASGGRATAHVDTPPHSHGTAVALLALEAAPDATLDLHIVSAGGAEIDAGIVAAAMAATAADIACLSLGIGVTPEAVDFGPLAALRNSDDTRALGEAALALAGRNPLHVRACPVQPCLCDAARRTCLSGPLMFAAAGNADDLLFCPALAGPVISVGFQNEERSAIPGATQTARAGKPGHEQSNAADLLLPAMPGVLGSSFAAPLVAGLAALGTARADWPGLLASGRLAADAAHLQTLAFLGRLDPAAFAFIGPLFDAALEKLPHADAIARQEHWCPASALVAASLLCNAGLHRLAAGQDVDSAQELLGAALHLDAHNADALANLAACHMLRAERGEQPAAHAGHAARLWRAAAEIRPDHADYRDAAGRAEALLHSMGGAP